MSHKLNGGGREQASQVPHLHWKICNLGLKSAFFFLPKAALVPSENGQMKGNSGYSTHAARLAPTEGPSRALSLHNMSMNRPQKAPKNPQNLCTLAADSPKPKTNPTLGYVAPNAISFAPNPPTTTHFWWFPPLKIALTNT